MAPSRPVQMAGRLLVQRLADTPAESLANITPALVDLMLATKAELVQSPNTAHQKPAAQAEQDVLQHRLKTQLSTLLQARKHQGRWAAVVLIKTFVEIGGPEILRGCDPWVRAMVGILGHKTEHWTVKKAIVTTLCRIFFLSYEIPSLVRDMTTPVLQSFWTHCLASIGSGDVPSYHIHAPRKLLRCILQSFILLLPRHPTSFRPHVNELRKVLSCLIAPTPSDPGPDLQHFPENDGAIARRLLSMLPNCANATANRIGPSGEWSRNVGDVLQHISRTADCVFRSLKETKGVSNHRRNHNETLSSYNIVSNDSIEDFLYLKPWKGINAGCERLIGCLKILEAFVATASQAKLALPVSMVWETIERIFSVYAPFKNLSGEEIEPTIHPEADREERESLWIQLPLLYEAALSLLSTLLRRMETLSGGLAEASLDHLIWIFEREHRRQNLRCMIYEAIGELVSSIGPTMKKSRITLLQPIHSAACADIQYFLAAHNDNDGSTASVLGQNLTMLGKEETQRSTALASSQKSTLDKLRHSALLLLRYSITQLPPKYLSPALRAEIDRAIIMAQDKTALLTTVLNPNRQILNGKNTSSNLPFLARAHPENEAVEALLRPRLPVIRGSKLELVDDEMDVDELNRRPLDTTDTNSDRQAEIRSTWSNGQTATSIDINVPDLHEAVVTSPKRARSPSPHAGASIPPSQNNPPSPKRVKEDVSMKSGQHNSVTADPEQPGDIHASVPDEVVAVQQAEASSEEENFNIPPIELSSDSGESGMDNGNMED